MKNDCQAIVWNDSLVTGVQVIDKQHQILVDMLNEANNRLTERSGREVFEEIVHDLLSYALYHFDTEEALMVTHHYDQSLQQIHFQEHRNFSRTVAQLQQDLQQNKLISRDELLGFLNGWLVNHIMKTDKQLGSFLCQPVADEGAIS